MSENQTPAQKAGFIIGNKYECIDDSTYPYIRKSAIYEFVQDDCTYAPLFKYISGPKAKRSSSDGQMYIDLAYLVPVKQPHKHAELIKAWADGAVIEVQICGDWLHADPPAWDVNGEYRIKPEEPKYIEVNGVKVPEPYRVKPEHGTTYYVPSISCTRELVGNWRWTNHDLDCINFQNGQCFKTAEDAIAAGNAMLKPFKA